jgi:ABC-2 type transport system ATP-binding protein
VRYAASQRRGFDAPSARRAIAEAGVPARSRASDLSGGQRVQLALAIAIGCGARVLLLDEPLASLDPLARRDIVRSLADYAHDREAAVVVSSHLVSDLEGAFDDLVLMTEGTVLVSGPIPELVAGWVVVPDDRAAPGPEQALGRFTGRDGSRWRVVGGAGAPLPADDRSRPATLEDVILALLASAPGGRAS